MEKFEIRKAKREDKKDILNLIESWKPYHWDTTPANEYFIRFFESDEFSQDKFFVGLIDNKIVSVIGYCPDRLNEIGVYWLGWFYTHKDYKQRGVGKSMFNFVISELITKKAIKLFVNTSSHSFYRSAVSFYQKMGFRKVDVLNDFYEKDEDQIIMNRKLDR
jgi:ribosomal protein S18 acetylase RimI-like enzyme